MNVGTGTASTVGLTVGMSGGTLRALPVELAGPGEVLQMPKQKTGLVLPNAGGTLVLKAGTAVLDVLPYPALPEGVGFGPDPQGIIRPLCLPTPGTPNASSGSQVSIAVQSGMPTGESVTLNLAVEAVAGSLKGATCRWTYPDGYANASCNPPAHALDSYGAGDITLEFTDYCGTTMVQILPVFVTKKPKKLEEEGKNGVLGFSCMPSAFSGALVSEILPNPDGDEAEAEWIEIENVSGKDLPLCGWYLEDTGGTRFDLKKFRIPLDDILVFRRKQTGITLNNDADAVRLVAPDPLGGSGTIIQEVPYTHAPAEESFALRDDGRWIWTPIKTPSLRNAFPDIPLPDGLPKARLSAAMPNPKGEDAATEWIEIENLTGRPLWMQKWKLVAGDSAIDLSGKAIHPYAKRRFLASDLGVTLRNASGAVRLFDEKGIEMQPLAWESPRDDAIVTPPAFAFHASGTVIDVREDGEAELQIGNADPFLFSPSFLHEYLLDEKCIDLKKALMKNKKVDLFFNSKIKEGAVAFVDGYDVGGQLVRHGCAYRSHASREGVLLGYGLYESEAGNQKRGVWADDAAAADAVALQSREDTLAVLGKEGLGLKASIASDLIESGAVLSFQTNLPAQVYVSIDDAPYVPMETGAIITGDTVIQAYAVLSVGSGSFRSDVFDHAYVLRRESYDRQTLLSEAYPSPPKGQEEWIELRNDSDRVVKLAGWTIDDGPDAGSKPFALGSEMAVQPHSYLILENLTVAWNNGGDAVRLIAPDGTVVDSIVYPTVKTGFGYALTSDGSWCLTERPSMQSANECYLSPKKTKKSNSHSALSKNKKSTSQSRKTVYRNILSDIDRFVLKDALFASLASITSGHSTVPKGDRPPFVPTLTFLLLFYITLIVLFMRFRRY